MIGDSPGPCTCYDADSMEYGPGYPCPRCQWLDQQSRTRAWLDQQAIPQATDTTEGTAR